MIERGQTEAIRLVQNTVNYTGAGSNVTQPDANRTNTSVVPHMVFVDDEGLEEQFLREDEVSQEVLNITAN